MTAGIVVVLSLLGALSVFSNSQLLFWDRPVRGWIMGIGGDGFGRFMDAVTKLGSRWVILVLLVPASFLAWKRCRQLAVAFPLMFLGTLVAELLLKAAVNRPRPAGVTIATESFPSGHVLAATAFWGLLPPLVYLMTRRRRAWAVATIAAGAIVTLVGISRVHLGAHWPSDVIAGWLAGALLLLVAEWMIRRPARRLRCRECEFHPVLGEDDVPSGEDLRDRSNISSY